MAIVNVQSSIYGSSTETLFVINLAVVPEPWLAFQHHGRALPKTLKESHGLWRDRLHPEVTGRVRGSEHWWSVTDAKSAASAASDALEQLQRQGVPKLHSLLDREAMIEAVRAGDLGFFRGDAHRAFFDVALAVLLADEGVSDELDAVLARLAKSDTERGSRAFDRVRSWLGDRLANDGSH